MKPKGIIVSGYFNPLHKGHLELFEKAKEQGDALFVIVNNDHQRILKGSQEFMLEDERVKIISALTVNDTVVLSICCKNKKTTISWGTVDNGRRCLYIWCLHNPRKM